jgi:hypothetical protein
MNILIKVAHKFCAALTGFPSCQRSVDMDVKRRLRPSIYCRASLVCNSTTLNLTAVARTRMRPYVSLNGDIDISSWSQVSSDEKEKRVDKAASYSCRSHSSLKSQLRWM